MLPHVPTGKHARRVTWVKSDAPSQAKCDWTFAGSCVALSCPAHRPERYAHVGEHRA